MIWYEGGLELRQTGNGNRELTGSFPYNVEAVISDRGSVRKERFSEGAFAYDMENPDREIHLLSGHDYNKPLASKQGGTLELFDREGKLEFVANLGPGEISLPSFADDIIRLIEQAESAGALRSPLGVSPGFRIPPQQVVPNAVSIIAEAGNPGVAIRVIRQANLYELSLVGRPAYPGTNISLRSVWDMGRRRRWIV